MPTERELAHELLDACRTLLRYDGIDPERVSVSMRQIRDIVGEWMHLREIDELDDVT